MSHTDPHKRHEFVLLFDVTSGNPNGDPDAGNLPRVDPETMNGLVTDVALKRKIRDYVAQVAGLPIFIQSQTALNTLILKGFREVGVEPPSIELTEAEKEDEALVAHLEGLEGAGLSYDEGQLVYSGEDMKKTDIQKRLKGELDQIDKELLKKLNALADRLHDASKKGGDKKAISKEKREDAKVNLIKMYYDIRMFGAVLSTGLNAGQVRGPVQLTFARSLDPIQPLDCQITRVAITKESDRQRKTTEMGRKPFVPYGLYRAHGFFNPFLGQIKKEDGQYEGLVSTQDLETLWEALEHLFDFDHSAARGEMVVRGLYVFTHNNQKGNAPAHKLFELIKTAPVIKGAANANPPRGFEDYATHIQVPPEGALEEFPGVTLKRVVG